MQEKRKIAIYTNDEEKACDAKKYLVEQLEKNNFIIDDQYPDVVITLGGDGTLLNGVHHYCDQLGYLRFTGVNAGHLGFYTDWKMDELDELVQSLIHDNGESAEYSLLNVTVHFDDENQQSQCYLALNESTLQKVTSTMIADIYIRGKFFEHFRGEGLCIATPTGSTAYNKSVGGAVVSSTVKVLQLTEVASINNSVYRTLGSPVILGPDEKLTIIPSSKSRYFLTIDAKSFRSDQMKAIDFSLAHESVKFVKDRHIRFWDRVQKSFIGNINFKD